MKRTLLNPGFEFMFAIGIITMLMLPPIVMAQQPPKKQAPQLKIVIQDNDTVVNGKNIKQLSKTERSKILKDMDDIGREMTFSARGDGHGPDHFTFMRRGNDGDTGRIFHIRLDTTADGKTMALHMKNWGMPGKYKDSADIVYLDPQFGRQKISIPKTDPQWAEERAHNRSDAFGAERGMFKMRRGEGRNSQSFNYSSTNKDGFSTNVSYHVSDVDRETAKKISGIEKPELAIDDLMLTPSFTTGKTNLSFTLGEKAATEVQLKNSDGKVLWTDKTTGSFTKSFELPQNGIYFLQVKQGNKIGLRRIVKEQ